MERQAIVTRVSSDGQRGNFSEEYQKDTCERYGNGMGWETYGQFHDVQTGTDYLKRKAVRTVLELLDSKIIQHVTFMSIDRVGRESEVIKQFVKDIYAKGGDVSIAGSNRTYESYLECITDQIWNIAQAEGERLRMMARTQPNRLLAFKKGSYAKRAPYGYRTVSSGARLKQKFVSLEVVESDGETIRSILTYFAKTRSKSATLRYANTEKLSYMGNPQSNWHPGTLKRTIAYANVYAGIPQILRYSPKEPVGKDNPEIEYTYPAIISLELAQAVNLANSLNDHKGTELKNPKPFTKLVWCECGKRANYEESRNLASSLFKCPTGQLNKRNRNLNRHVRYENACNHGISPVILERVLRAYLYNLDSELFISELEIELMDYYMKAMNLMADITAIKASRDSAEIRRKRYRERILETDPIEFPDFVAEINSAIKELQFEIDNLAERESPIKQELNMIEKTFSQLDLPLFNNLLHEIGEWEPDEQDEKLLEEIYRRYSGLEIMNLGLDQIIPELRHRIHPRMTKVRSAVQELSGAVDHQDWEKVSYLMALLGLRFRADFAEPGISKRRKTIRIEMSLENPMPVDENTLGRGFVSNGAGCAHRPARFPAPGGLAPDL